MISGKEELKIGQIQKQSTKYTFQMRIKNNLDPTVMHIINRCPSGTSCLWLATLENFWCQKWQQSYRTFITLSFRTLKSMDARKKRKKNLVKSSCGHLKKQQQIVIKSQIVLSSSAAGNWKKKHIFFRFEFYL